MTDELAPIHYPCGNQMTPSVFGPYDPTPSYRGQPIWTCDGCSTWAPRTGWHGALPADWNPDTRAWK